MAHMIDETTGTAAIAYRGNEPWHGLGQTIDADDDIDTIIDKAKLGYQVVESPVLFKASKQTAPGEFTIDTRVMPGRKVLYRGDTQAPLSVVSDDYHPVQPREIVAFFDEMVKSGGFHIETVGALSGGRRVWALAKLGDGAKVIGDDIVRPYLMLATSYDGTMATVAKYVKTRVVCHNTITAAAGEHGHQVKVYHSQKFDATRVRQDTGVALNAFDEWIIKARLLATLRLKDEEAAAFTEELFRPRTKVDDVRQSRGYQSVMTLFDGAALGSGFTQGGTAWQLLNAVTEYVDHTRGRGADTRLNSAWFGDGDKLKSDAEAKLLALVA